MLHIVATEFLATWTSFENARQMAWKNRGTILNHAQRNLLVEILCKLNGHCNYMGLHASAELSKSLLSWLQDPANYREHNPAGGYTMPKEPPLPDFESVYKYLQDIGAKIHKEIIPIRLSIAPLGKTQFLDQDQLFGEKVFLAFEEARDDIKNAGNCVALGLNNAAIFYLMCVVERSLRRLADNLGVTNAKPNITIELGTWNDVISALQKEIDAGAPRSKAAALAKLNHYSEALIEFRAIEHFWRNKVMHTRANYNGRDAEEALVHVGRFMNKLAEL
jgi:hypothetical protein